MDRYSEEEVAEALRPFHARIKGVIHQAYSEWLAVKACRRKHGFAPVLYSRTVSNYVFDAIARGAISEFGADPFVWVKEESQTVKFCFSNVVIARFKKGDEDNLGQNHPTQAALDFVEAQQTLPGFPPAAAKVEFIWTTTILEDGIAEVLVVARDGDRVLWSYPIFEAADDSGVIDLITEPPDDSDDGERLVVPKKGSDAEIEGE